MIRNRIQTIGIAALVLATSGVTAATEDASMTDIEDIEGLKTAFNEGVGKPRLILLLSPT